MYQTKLESLHHCRDLVKLRLKTAEAYVKVLTGTQDAVNGTTGSKNSHLTLSAGVSGLGPNFQVAIKVSSAKQLLRPPMLY